MKSALCLVIAGLVSVGGWGFARAEYGASRPDGASAPARDLPLDADAQAGAVAALKASLEVERDILRGQQQQYRDAAADRESADRKVQQLLSELDAIVEAMGPAFSEAAQAKEREIAESENRRLAAIDRCRSLLGRIEEIQDRVAGLERKIAVMRESLPRISETLSGSWKIILLPTNGRGVIALKQTGTIVQGQYQLDGGWKGSLQGTFIDGKVYLQRIDSKLGRNAEFEGFLAQDGTSIRGTWRSYGLADGAVSMGSWTATRLEE